MAKFDINEYNNFTKSSSSEEKSKVEYFNLKEDGDYAIVRFAYHSQDDFDIVTVHRVMMEGRKYPVSVSCLRGAKDELSKCPLCSSHDEEMKRLYMKMYVKMIRYEKDENGNLQIIPCVWERPASFSKKLLSLIGAGYSDLSKYIFMIKRNGAKGSTSTTYDINPCNPNVYPNDVFVEDFSAFDGFDLTRHSYYEKSYEDLQVCATSGVLPGYKPKEGAIVIQQTPSVETNYTQPQVSVPPTQSAVMPPNVNVGAIPTPTPMGFGTSVTPLPTQPQVSVPSTPTTSSNDGVVRPRRPQRY